jgi:hypothetical protein
MGLRLLNSVPCVARMLFLPAIVRNSPNDLFGIVTASKGAFGECPIPLRLGDLASRGALCLM